MLNPCRHCRLNKARATAENTTAKHTDLVKVRACRNVQPFQPILPLASSWQGFNQRTRRALPARVKSCTCARCCVAIYGCLPNFLALPGGRGDEAQRGAGNGRPQGRAGTAGAGAWALHWDGPGSQEGRGWGRGEPHAEVKGLHQAPSACFKAWVIFRSGWPFPALPHTLPPHPPAKPARPHRLVPLPLLPSPGHPRPGAREGAVCGGGGRRKRQVPGCSGGGHAAGCRHRRPAAPHLRCA